MTAKTKRSVGTQSLIATVFMIVGGFLTTVSGVVPWIRDGIETRDNVRHVVEILDSMRGIPPQVQSIKQDIVYIKASQEETRQTANANSQRIAVLETDDREIKRQLLLINTRYAPIDGVWNKRSSLK